MIHSGQDNTLSVYAALGPSSNSKQLLPTISTHNEVYSVLNHAASFQQPLIKKEPEDDKADPYAIGECIQLYNRKITVPQAPKI